MDVRLVCVILIIIIIVLLILLNKTNPGKDLFTVIDDAKISGHENNPAVETLMRDLKMMRKTATPTKKVENDIVRYQVSKYNQRNDAVAQQIQADLFENIIINRLFGYVPNLIGIGLDNQNMQHAQMDMLNNDLTNTRVTRRTTLTDTGIWELPETMAPKHVYDPQNVHDKGVNNHINSVLDDIYTTKHGIDYNDLWEWGNNNDLKEVFDTIYTNNVKINGRKEVDILATMYSMADTPEKKESLISSLKDCVENDHVVCTTGRINRIVASLSHLDDAVGPVLTYDMLRSTALSKGAKILKDELEKLSDVDKTKYNNSDLEWFDKEVKEKMDVELSDYDPKIIEEVKMAV